MGKHKHGSNKGHATHPEAILRLKRAGGHLNKVVEMLEKEKPCADILQQLSAVIAALANCRIVLLQDHINSCIRPAIKPGHQQLIDEIEVVVKRALKGT